MLAPEGPVSRGAEIRKVHVGGEATDIIIRALKQQRVPNTHHDVIKLAAEVSAAPMDRHRIDAVAPPEPELPERVANHAAAGKDEGFDGRSAGRGDAIDQPHLLGILETKQFLHLRAKHDPVALGQSNVRKVASQALVAADHVDKPHPLALEDRDLRRACTDEGRALRHDDLGEILGTFPRAQQVRDRLAFWQERRHEDPHGAEPDDADDQAERCDFEQAEGRHALRARHAVNQNVGRGTDHRDHPAQHGLVG